MNKYARLPAAAIIMWISTFVPAGRAQGLLSGHLRQPVDSTEPKENSRGMGIGEIRVFGAHHDPLVEPSSFRTWQSQPAGWFRLSGPEGWYTLLLTEPAHYMRPLVRTNVFLSRGERLEGWNLVPQYDYRCQVERSWDTQPATAYFQPFIATSTSVTNVGLKLATDGVDGAGPGRQDLVIAMAC